MSRTRLSVRAAVPVALTTALLLAGCGGSDDESAAAEPAAEGSTDSAVPDTSDIVGGVSEDAALAEGLPADLASLSIGSNVQSPPNNFYAEDGSTPVGFEVDIITAIGNKLGLDVEYSDMAFDSLITGLQTGRVDATIAGMNDTPERQESIDFVDYFESGITIMVQKGNPAGIEASADLCGQAIAVVQGTTQEDFAAEQSAECEANGEEPLEVTATPSDSQNQTQLRTGRVDAILNDLPTAVYISQTAGDGEYFETVDQDPINGGPYGIGLNKDDAALRDAIQQALQSLIDDGTYDEILEAWDVTSGAVDQATVNGG
ncbi:MULTISPECIES: ABC transporter substrate-binding protein [unclassified Modestobacter]|uniref:ABC transporter substrate-binding protein n=1 Tax=unclassified Modestobacter TaxID=2643866 RepID=UPI0022AAEBB0|nr:MULTISPECIES: ABC transporter substrate-binding protein [unclassified Modestobacter]MCZ2822807.1 ABC transporter substrate-binding protein [Modestobacter sp. VKM Ac-2981]MCZ2851053.1 ABC transporter substrate-binding protein [Modestobacter sp. VKM Ac-2982]